MTTIHRAPTRADGSNPLLPRGVFDMSTIEGSEAITPELEAKLKEALIKDPAKQTAATFKLEVLFKHGARNNVEVHGGVQAWTNGGYFGGGGDMAVYFCPQPREDSSGLTCLHPIDVQHAVNGKALCLHCKKLTPQRQLINIITADLSMTRWASFLTRLFYLLDCSADIVHHIERGSITEASRIETAGDKRGEVYAKVDSGYEQITYPLASIIRDTASGATLESRISAFLKA